MSRPVTRRISGSGELPPATLAWSDELGKRVRRGDFAELAVSTTRKILDSIQSGHWEVAAQLLDYWLEEAKIPYVICAVWMDGFVEWFRTKGVPEREVEVELERLRTLLAFPDGGPYDPSERWNAISAAAGSLAGRLRVYEITAEAAATELDAVRESWRQLDERITDMIGGLLTFVAARFGEAAIEDCFRFVLEPYLQERYKPYDPRERPYEETTYRNLVLSFESMHAHLVGPARQGDVEFEEHDDRYVLRFDPCGSGGRMMRGDLVEGTPSRAEPPYNFGFTREEHDWAWNEKGVCYYCSHCCFALERWPAEQWGHPVRVVDSPLYPDETGGPEPKKCTWTIYKHLEAIPPEAYERIGLRKPD
jgi:hypothetical protein